MAAKGQYSKTAKPDSVRQRKYNGTPEQKKRRAERNATRRELEKKGRVRKGDGKDVDHVNHKTSDRSAKNLKVVSKSTNRAKNLGTGGRKKKS